MKKYAWIFVLLISVMATSCKTQSTIAGTAHIPQATIIRDTVMQHDSIYVHEFMQGDTVYVTKYRDRWRDKVVNRTDTVYVQPVPTAPQTPATIPRFYKRCTWGFWILLLLTLGRIAFRILKAIYLH